MEKLIIESKDAVLSKADQEYYDKMMKEGSGVSEDFFDKRERTIRWEYPEIVFQSIKSKDELMEFLYDEGINAKSLLTFVDIPNNLKEIINDSFAYDYIDFFDKKVFNKVLIMFNEEERNLFKKKINELDEDQLEDFSITFGFHNQDENEIANEIRKVLNW